jgi:hypothetical protein
MRWGAHLLAIASVLHTVYADAGAGLYPPNYMPLLRRADSLLAGGQYNDAVRAFSEVIGAHHSVKTRTQ